LEGYLKVALINLHIIGIISLFLKLGFLEAERFGKTFRVLRPMGLMVILGGWLKRLKLF